MIRALVLRTAGTNCDRETGLALEAAAARTELLHVRRLVEEPRRLEGYRVLVIPGGFSYGDDVAAGRALGFEIRHDLAGPLSEFVEAGGHVLGVCNGFQVLVDTGILEGVPRSERGVALSGNSSARFECRWITLRSERSACRWLEPGEVWPAPVAHGEGRVLVRDAATLARLERNGQIALRYVRPPADRPPDPPLDPSAPRSPDPGSGEERAGYPDCPNGSVQEIAGLCDPTGRVLGLMPHPERNVTPWHHPRWTRLGARAEGEGLAFYRRLVEVASANA